MLIKLDDLIESRFQKFSEWTQVEYNKNCYWWEYVSARSAAVILCALGIYLLLPWTTHQFRSLPTDFLGSLCLLAGLCVSLFSLIAKHRSTQAKGQAPLCPLLLLKTIRLIFLASIPVDVAVTFVPNNRPVTFVVIFDIAVLLVVSMFYFHTCIPLPPEVLRQKRSVKISDRNARFV